MSDGICGEQGQAQAFISLSSTSIQISLKRSEVGRDGIKTTCFSFIIKPDGLKLKHDIW